MKKDDTSDFTFFPACLARTPTPRPLIATVAVRKNSLITHERLLDKADVNRCSLITHVGRGGLP